MRTAKIAALFAAVILSGCDPAPYQVSSSASGQHYLINRWSGTIYRIDEKNLIELGTVSLSKWTTVTKPKYLSSQSPPQYNFSVSVQTRFMDDQVSYKVLLNPKAGTDESSKIKWDSEISQAKHSLGKAVTVNFEDDAEFRVSQVIIPVAEFAEIVNEKGEAISYEAKGEVKLSLAAYERVAGWALEWNF